jgi:hypothetical protein
MSARVYVIELTAAAGRRRDPRIPWVYVGSSARDPETRFDQHLNGYRSSGLVKRFALRLRPDLYEDLQPFRTSAKAQAAEVGRARELADAGFVAHCDGTSYGRGAGGWAEWGASRLEPVAAHVDAAAAELFAATFEPLDPYSCARLIHGERGFWLQRYIDPGDPPPAYGRFAHVRLDVLEERCGAYWSRRVPSTST